MVNHKSRMLIHGMLVESETEICTETKTLGWPAS